MICTTIQNRDLEGIWEVLQRPDIEMAEIRLDRTDLGLDEIEELFSSSDVPLIATCRCSSVQAESSQEAARIAESRLITAIKAGAAYVDLEIEAPAMMSKRIRREAFDCGCTLVRSWHDFEGTDSPAALRALVDKCTHLGAEVVKLVTTARDEADCQKVMGLYEDYEPGTLVAFCMGAEGRQTRLDCLAKGAPWTYAALSEEEAAAPGQWATDEIRKAVYGDFNFCGGPALRMPSSKSFAQRAIIAAALSEGTSVLRGYSPCGDNESAIAAARALGAKVEVSGDTVTIVGNSAGKLSCESFHTGESGFLTRMLIPLLGVLAPGGVRITGEKTLLNRPLAGAPGIMEKFGVSLDSDRVPLNLSGHLTASEADIDGSHGSQLISGLLAALPLCEEDSVLRVEKPKSLPYLFITIEVLRHFGIRIENEMEGGEEFAESGNWDLCDAVTFRIRGGQKYTAADLNIEADWSSAANFLVAGALFGSADIEGLDTHSLQADLSIMDILAEAGASLSQLEDSGLIHVQRAPLRSFEIDAGNCPDLFPIVSVLAAFCPGRSKISGVKRLAGKESDRGKSILDMLQGMGVRASIKGDTLTVTGKSLAQRLLTGSMLRSGSYTSSRDHRMVMALKVASAGADGEVKIDDIQCVSKSFPTFFDIYGQLWQ